MKNFIVSLIPRFLINKLQRLQLGIKLLRPYTPVPLSLAEIPAPDFKSGYAKTSDKETAPFNKIMRKLNSYMGAGPIGPNKYWEYPWIIKNLDLKPRLRILDAGCGRSPIQYLLADIGMLVSGIDPFENVGWHGIDRRLARKYGLDIDYRVEGMENISFADKTFDRVVSASVLEHCRAQITKDEVQTPQSQADRDLQAKMMKEMARVLKTGGLLIITLDIIFPRNKAVLECNIDVKNLIEASGLTLLPPDAGVTFYGYKNFAMQDIENSADIDFQDYAGAEGTSLGLIFKK